jgi:DinB superfamily
MARLKRALFKLPRWFLRASSILETFKKELFSMKPRIALALPVLALIFSIQVLSANSFAQTPQPRKPATLRSILLHELHTTHTEADWFVPISVAIDGLTSEQASWQPAGGGHSAGQLTYHLLFWNRLNLSRLKGESKSSFTGNNDETFEKFDNKQWADTMKGLDQVMTDLEKLVESADDKKLSEIAPTIANICTHNAYHVGQIVYVRKLQGSWNPDKGVK